MHEGRRSGTTREIAINPWPTHVAGTRFQRTLTQSRTLQRAAKAKRMGAHVVFGFYVRASIQQQQQALDMTA